MATCAIFGRFLFWGSKQFPLNPSMVAILELGGEDVTTLIFGTNPATLNVSSLARS